MKAALENKDGTATTKKRVKEHEEEIEELYYILTR